MPEITIEQQNAGALGGASQGFSAKPVVLVDRDSSINRTILRRAWNGKFLSGNVAGDVKSKMTPFRLATNSGDYLGRVNYSCGGVNQVTNVRTGNRSHIGSIFQRCDGTDIPASTCNTKYVYDSSEFIKYKGLRARLRNYNDSKF